MEGVYTLSNVCVCLQLCVFTCGHVPACVWHLGSTLLTSRPPSQRFLAFPSNMAILGIDVNQLCNSSSLVVWPVTFDSDRHCAYVVENIHKSGSVVLAILAQFA